MRVFLSHISAALDHHSMLIFATLMVGLKARKLEFKQNRSICRSRLRFLFIVNNSIHGIRRLHWKAMIGLTCRRHNLILSLKFRHAVTFVLWIS